MEKAYKHNIDIHCLALPLVFTVATLTFYTLSEWDLTPYDSATVRQSLTPLNGECKTVCKLHLFSNNCFNSFVQQSKLSSRLSRKILFFKLNHFFSDHKYRLPINKSFYYYYYEFNKKLYNFSVCWTINKFNVFCRPTFCFLKQVIIDI